MPKIQYEDKQKAIDFNSPALNEMFTFQDANEIKYSVNELYDDLEEVNLQELRQEVATNTVAVLEAKEDVFATLPVRVATYAGMTALLRLNKPRNFTVIADEFQGVEKVPYSWDGVELFVYGTLVDPQPIVTQ